MKNIFKYSLLIFLFYTQSLFGCYIPCDSYAIQKSNEAQQFISSAYDELDNKIEDSEDAYKDYLKSLEKQNKLLEQITRARKYNTTQMKKVNFLLKKIIENKNITIDIETLNALKRLNNQTIIQEIP